MAAKRSALPEGYLLGDYRIERILGAGGFGITYLARDAALKRLFAIKEYCPHELSKREGTTVYPFTDVRDDYERGLSDFIKEAQTLARYHHRNIVGVARIFEANNTAYMVLNFEEGASLKEWLKDRDKKPTQKEIDAIAAPLLDALEVIHADGTLHRDIAPDNIYIRKDGTPVLLDFGSARQALNMRSRSVSAIVKAGYSPQEQYSTRASNQGSWTDIYSLGATLYRAVAGETPPEASDRTIDDHYQPLAAQRIQGYRPTFLAAIDWSLALRPKDRPQFVSDWRGSLLHNKPVPAIGKGKAVAPAPAKAGSKGMALAAAALAGVLATGVGGFYIYSGGAQTVASETGPDAGGGQTAEADRRAQADAAAADELRKAREEADAARKKLVEAQAAAEAARKKAEDEAETARKAAEADRLRLAEEAEAARRQAEAEAETARLAALEAAKRDAEAERLRLTEEAARRKADAEAEAQRVRREKAEAEAAELRRQAQGSSVEFSGLELGPVDASGAHLVRAVSAASPFQGKVRPAEKLVALTRNGSRLDLSDPARATGASRTLAACDVLVAEVGAGNEARKVQIVLPQAYGASGAPAAVLIAQLGIGVSTSASGAPVLAAVATDSPFTGAGLAPGDLIRAVSGKPVDTFDALRAAAEVAMAAGGPHPVRFLRDCVENTATVDFSLPPITVEWVGLSLSGSPSGPAVVTSVDASSPFAASIRPGDVITDVTVGGANTLLARLSDVRDTLRSKDLCGNVQLRYARAGTPGSVVATAPLPARQEEFDLSELGVKGWILTDGTRLEIASVDSAKRPGWEPGIRAGDMIERFAGAAAVTLARLGGPAQIALLEAGGRLAVRRGCDDLDILLPTYAVPRDEPLEPGAIAAADRSAILKALHALGHYRSPYIAQDFVASGTLDFQTRTAIAAFKTSRGAPADEGLRPSEIELLRPQGTVDLPGDREVATLSQVIPPEIAANSARYIRRIDLFLQAKGFVQGSQRSELARYLASLGIADNPGYIDRADVARAIFIETLDINVSAPGETRFGAWTFREDEASNTCEVYVRPTQIQGLMFDFFLQGTPGDSPRISLSVARRQSGNAMVMNFGGFAGYAATDVPTVLTSTGKAIPMSRDGGRFLPSNESGAMSTDLHKALAAGATLDIVGASAHGGGLRIRYPADGFREAFMHMRSRCGVRAIDDWLN